MSWFQGEVRDYVYRYMTTPHSERLTGSNPDSVGTSPLGNLSSCRKSQSSFTFNLNRADESARKAIPSIFFFFFLENHFVGYLLKNKQRASHIKTRQTRD